MYCAVRKCVIVGMNQVDYEEDEGLLWHPEVKSNPRMRKILNYIVNLYAFESLID